MFLERNTFRTGFCVHNKVCQRRNDMFVGNCEELIERCIQNCLVCLGACRTRRCLVVLQCVVHLLGVPVKPPPDVLFILRSLSCLLSGLQECDKLTSCSSDDCSPRSYLLPAATCGRQATQPFGYLEVHISFRSYIKTLSFTFL